MRLNQIVKQYIFSFYFDNTKNNWHFLAVFVREYPTLSYN